MASAIVETAAMDASPNNYNDEIQQHNSRQLRGIGREVEGVERREEVGEGGLVEDDEKAEAVAGYDHRRLTGCKYFVQKRKNKTKS